MTRRTFISISPFTTAMLWLLAFLCLHVPAQAVENQTGAVSWAAKYSSFGAASVETENVVNPIRFPGQYFDPETGLHQNLMRDYDTATGAYLEQDPYGILMGPNLYGYAAGNPLGYTDPTGEMIPLLVLGGYLFFAVDIAFTGFATYHCFKYFQDSCLYSEDGQYCKDAGMSIAGLAVGAGVWRFGGRLVGKAAPWLRNTRFFKSEAGALRLPFGRQTPDQKALTDLAKELKRRSSHRPLTKEETDILRDWAEEVGVKFRGPEIHPRRTHGKSPHVHIGPVDHIFGE